MRKKVVIENISLAFPEKSAKTVGKKISIRKMVWFFAIHESSPIITAFGVRKKNGVMKMILVSS